MKMKFMKENLTGWNHDPTRLRLFWRRIFSFDVFRRRRWNRRRRWRLTFSNVDIVATFSLQTFSLAATLHFFLFVFFFVENRLETETRFFTEPLRSPAPVRAWIFSCSILHLLDLNISEVFKVYRLEALVVHIFKSSKIYRLATKDITQFQNVFKFKSVYKKKWKKFLMVNSTLKIGTMNALSDRKLSYNQKSISNDITFFQTNEP